MGHSKKLLKRATRLASQFPNNPNLLNILGAVNLNLGFMDRALELYSKALQQAPGDSTIIHNCGVVYEKLDQHEKALSYYRASLMINPGYPDPYKSIGIDFFVRNNNPFGALPYYKKYLYLNPTSVGMNSDLALILDRCEREEDALKQYKRTILIEPQFFEPYFNFGLFCRNVLYASMLVKALSCRALILKPDYAKAMYLRALFMLDTFDLKAAEAYSRKSLLADPSYEGALDNYKISVFLDKGYIPKDFSPHNIKSSLSGDIQETSITSLVSMGRSGSLFLHSLFDGHPQISTLPGVYFKGWFSSPTWEIFKPDYTQPNWRETLANRIIQKYEPMFDARSKINVPGKPLSGNWISRNLGFMNMGPDRKEHFYADKERFYTQMLALLKPFTEVTQKIVFELIHQAFKNCFEGDIKKEPDKPSSIFYHIHNPSFEELSHYRDTYPNSKQLLIVRNPVQSLESHIISVLPEDSWEGNSADFSTIIKNWTQATLFIRSFLFTFTSPNVDSKSWRGVKLEDLKSNPKETLEKLVQWIGIPFHPTLLNSTFGNLEYWGPLSPNSAPIRGFDKANLQQKKGRFLDEKT